MIQLKQNNYIVLSIKVGKGKKMTQDTRIKMKSV